MQKGFYIVTLLICVYICVGCVVGLLCAKGGRLIVLLCFFCHALLVAPASEVATMFAFIRGWTSTGASRHVVPSMALH